MLTTCALMSGYGDGNITLLTLLPAALLLLGLCLIRVRARDLRVQAVLALVLLEELGTLGFGLAYTVSPARQAGMAVASAVALVLMLRVPLPEALFPLRGRWLRRGLAVAAVAGLAQVSWPVLAQEYLRLGTLPSWPLLLGFPLCLWLMKSPVELLERGLVPQLRPTGAALAATESH